jgi:Cu(I)/Ag(I) efflux system membrane fusion protein
MECGKMKIVISSPTIAVPVVALLLASCEPSPNTSGAGAGAETSDRPVAQQQAAPGKQEHVAEGTVNSIDRAAGTVNISHGPVASASWPAMTMGFKLADPSAADNLRPGQKVDFHFTIESGMSATVTRISPAE